MNLSVNAVRALILLGNVVLLGLVGWLCFDTFVAVDAERYFVKPPDPAKYAIPEVSDDPRRTQKELYKAITRVLDREPPPPPPPPEAPPPPKPQRPNPRDIKVMAIQFSENQERASALLLAPGAQDPKFFQVGLDLGIPGLGLEPYKDCKVKAITADEVIVTDQDGNEVRIPGPRPKT